MMVQSKPKHVGAFVIYFNVNFNVLNQIYCALCWSNKRLDNVEMHGTTVKKNHVHEVCTHFHGHQNRTLKCTHFPNKTTITYNVTLKRLRAIIFAVDRK